MIYKKLVSGFKRFFYGSFGLIASAASIISLCIIFLVNKDQTIIALCAFIIFLIIILFRFFSISDSILLKKHETGFHKFATYVKYATDDGKHITYDLQKYIQCKTLSVSEYEHAFYWSGSKDPLISSQLQDVVNLIRSTNGGLDKAILKFRKPLIYNEFCIIHIKMDLDDSDGKSKHFLQQTIKENVHIVHFRVELRHLENNPDAKIMKRPCGAVEGRDYEIINYVSFDKSSRSYEYVVFNPLMGFDYRIEWP